MLNCQCQLPTKLAVAKTPISIGSANCQQNWQLLKRQLPLAVETANRNWRQFWSQPRLPPPVILVPPPEASGGAT